MIAPQIRRSPWRTVAWVVFGLPAAAILVLILGLLTIPLQNDAVARGIENGLRELPAPADTEVVESFSKVGRWAGAGNGTMYLGAMLIRSDLPRSELEAFYSDLGEHGPDPAAEPELLHPRVLNLAESDRLEDDVTREFGAIAQQPSYFVIAAVTEDAPSSWHHGFDLRGH